MLSSLNAFSGSSALVLLTSISANSSSSSGAKSTSAAPSTSFFASATAFDDPARTIQSILAEAQIQQSVGLVSTSLELPLNATVEAAYAEYTSTSSYASLSSVTQIGWTQQAISQETTVAHTDASTGSVTIAETEQSSAGWGNPSETEAAVITITPIASASGSSADYIQLSAAAEVQTSGPSEAALGFHSATLNVSFGFVVDGLGNVASLAGSQSVLGGAKAQDSSVHLQVASQDVGVGFQIDGLSASQAQLIMRAFSQAAASVGTASEPGATPSNALVYSAYGAGSLDIVNGGNIATSPQV